MRYYEEGKMNKWIPISLFVFFSIYLLTTAQATFTGTPATAIATSLGGEPVHQIQYQTQ